MQVLTVCGSLSPRSYNRAALATVQDLLFERAVLVDDLLLPRLPPFDAEQVDAAPAVVQEFRAQFDAADAVVLATPEYAGGLSGVLKNGLDWLVGTSQLYRRPVGILSIATGGGGWARQALARTLGYQGAHLAAQLGIAAPRTKFADDGTVHDEATLRELAAFSEAVLDAAGLDEEGRTARTSEVAAALGVTEDRVPPAHRRGHTAPAGAPECYSCGQRMEVGTVVAEKGLYWDTARWDGPDWIIGGPLGRTATAARCRACNRLVLFPYSG